jgi:hypothetical protein
MELITTIKVLYYRPLDDLKLTPIEILSGYQQQICKVYLHQFIVFPQYIFWLCYL